MQKLSNIDRLLLEIPHPILLFNRNPLFVHITNPLESVKSLISNMSKRLGVSTNTLYILKKKKIVLNLLREGVSCAHIIKKEMHCIELEIEFMKESEED